VGSGAGEKLTGSPNMKILLLFLQQQRLKGFFNLQALS
jgi:hypothetical protein